LTSHSDELQFNGYFLCRGKSLKDFKLQFGRLINKATKTTILGLFNFRAFLNIGMLLAEGEKAKQVRNLILDIVIATIHEKAGGGTKYINRRDIDYLPAAIAEIDYRKALTSAINQCVDGHKTMKYAQITDYIYKAVFKENAKEYREILRLKDTENPHKTMYAEVLLMIAAFENGVGYEIKEKFKSNGEQLLSMQEVYAIIDKFAEHPFQQPHLNDVRTKMASRDLSFRDAYHGNIAASNIDNELLLRIMACTVDCQDFDEGLKIDIINAMQKSENTGNAEFTKESAVIYIQQNIMPSKSTNLSQ
jgi:hypothetical protein